MGQSRISDSANGDFAARILYSIGNDTNDLYNALVCFCVRPIVSFVGFGDRVFLSETRFATKMINLNMRRF